MITILKRCQRIAGDSEHEMVAPKVAWIHGVRVQPDPPGIRGRRKRALLHGPECAAAGDDFLTVHDFQLHREQVDPIGLERSKDVPRAQIDQKQGSTLPRGEEHRVHGCPQRDFELVGSERSDVLVDRAADLDWELGVVGPNVPPFVTTLPHRHVDGEAELRHPVDGGSQRVLVVSPPASRQDAGLIGARAVAVQHVQHDRIRPTLPNDVPHVDWFPMVRPDRRAARCMRRPLLRHVELQV
jgi:hypothetical protein